MLFLNIMEPLGHYSILNHSISERMTIMLIYRTYIWGLHQVQEIYRILAKNSWAKKQESTMKPTPGKCSREKIFDHFIKHFNTTRLVHSVALKELSGNLPEFVRELQNISNNLPINHEVPTIDEIQKHLHQWKSGKASDNVDPELLKKYEHSLMLQVIDRMANKLWSNLHIPVV